MPRDAEKKDVPNQTELVTFHTDSSENPAEPDPIKLADELFKKAKQVREETECHFFSDVLFGQRRIQSLFQKSPCSDARLSQAHIKTVNLFHMSASSGESLNRENNPLAWLMKEMRCKKEMDEIYDHFRSKNLPFYSDNYINKTKTAALQDAEKGNFEKLDALLEKFRYLKKRREDFLKITNTIARLQNQIKIVFPGYEKEPGLAFPYNLFHEIENGIKKPLDEYRNYQEKLQSFLETTLASKATRRSSFPLAEGGLFSDAGPKINSPDSPDNKTTPPSSPHRTPRSGPE